MLTYNFKHRVGSLKHTHTAWRRISLKMEKTHLVITKVTLRHMPRMNSRCLPMSHLMHFHCPTIPDLSPISFFFFFLNTQTPFQLSYPILEMKIAPGSHPPTIRGLPRSYVASELVQVQMPPATTREGLVVYLKAKGRVSFRCCLEGRLTGLKELPIFSSRSY